MEEILASIRRIIEDNDAGRNQQAEPEQNRAAPPPLASAERTVIEVDAFRNELRTPPVEMSAPAPQKKPVTLAEVQAQITAEAAAMPSRWMDPAPAAPEKVAPEKVATERPVERSLYERSPDDIKKAIENSRAAREDARALLGIPEPANTARPPEPREERAGVRQGSGDRRTLRPRDAEPSLRLRKASLPSPPFCPNASSARWLPPSRELSEAFAARSRKTFDEMAEEMIAPLLRDWMENNLPTLVERLVREEIERVARGAQ